MIKGPDGKPVPDALVLASPALGSFGSPVSARSDEHGRFRLVFERPTPHQLSVQAKGLVARTIPLARPGSSLTIALEKGGVIEGTIVDAQSGAPLPRARAEILLDQGLAWEPQTLALSAEADAKGHYRLEGVPRRMVAVTACARGYALDETQAIPGAKGLDFRLLAGAALIGIVRGPSGVPVAGAVVRAEPEERPWSGRPSVRTDEQGRFEIWGVKPGAYTVVARHAHLAPGVAAGVVVRPESEAFAEVRLQRGTDVVGRLLGPGERPLKGTVLALELDGRRSSPQLIELLRAKAGDDGRFRLAALPPGSHTLAAMASSFATTQIPVEVTTGPAVVDVGNVRLGRGLLIRGRVMDTKGTPIAAASIAARWIRPTPGLPVPEATSEADGSFVLSGLEAGDYWLRVLALGYATVSRPVKAGSTIEIALHRGAAVSGMVVDDEGSALPFFNVRVGESERAPTVAFDSFLNSEGRFLLEDVAPGTYGVSVAAPERVPSSLHGVRLDAGRTTDVGTLRLTRGGSVRGVVADSEGSPVAGATVAVEGAAVASFLGVGPSAQTDAEGVFEIRGAPPGDCVARARHPSYLVGRSAIFEVAVAGPPAEIRIVLARGARIEGSARRLDGAPLVPASVRAITRPRTGDMDVSPKTVPVEPDGSFAIDTVMPGSIVVVLQHSAGARSHQTRTLDLDEGQVARVDFVARDIVVGGRVTRAGTPLSGVELHLSCCFGPRSQEPGAESASASATTDGDGRYSVIVTASGLYQVSVSSGEPPSSWQRNVEIPEVDAFTLDLDLTGAGTTIRGVVVEAQTGRPLEAQIGALLNSEAAGTGGASAFHSTAAGADGRFSLELPEGSFGLSVSAEGHLDENAPLRIPADAGRELRFALRRESQISGRVLMADGRGAGFVEVLALSQDGEATTSTAADGSFRIDGLEELPAWLIAGSQLAGFAWREIGPDETQIMLTLQRGGRVRLTASSPDGSPLRRASAVLSRVDGHLLYSNFVDGAASGDGVIELIVPAARVEIVVRSGTFSGAAELTVGSGETVDAEIQLSPSTDPP